MLLLGAAFKYEGYEHYDYQCPSESRHDNIVPSEDDDSKVVENVHVPFKFTSVIEGIS